MYKKLWKDEGYDNLRNPGSVPEYVKDPHEENLWHALSGAKRAKVWDQLSHSLPNHKHVKEFEGFEVRHAVANCSHDV